jgi:predicted membrane chloride channel (bestrophin family)
VSLHLAAVLVSIQNCEHVLLCARFGVLKVVAVKILLVFWNVTSYSLVIRYRRLRGTYCLDLQGTVKTEEHTVMKRW